MDDLCLSTLLDLSISAGGEEVTNVLVEWAAAEGLDLYPPEKAAGASLAVATPAGDGISYEVGTRQEFLVAFNTRQLWKDAASEAINLLWFIKLATAVSGQRGWLGFGSLLLAAMYVAPCVAIMLLAHRRSPAFIRWRVPSLVALRLIRVALNMTLSLFGEAWPNMTVAFISFALEDVLPTPPRGHLAGDPLRILSSISALVLPASRLLLRWVRTCALCALCHSPPVVVGGRACARVWTRIHPLPPPPRSLLLWRGPLWATRSRSGATLPPPSPWPPPTTATSPAGASFRAPCPGRARTTGDCWALPSTVPTASQGAASAPVRPSMAGSCSTLAPSSRSG